MLHNARNDMIDMALLYYGLYYGPCERWVMGLRCDVNIAINAKLLGIVVPPRPVAIFEERR